MAENYEIGLVAGLDELKSEQQLQKLIPKIIEKAEQKFREKGIELPLEIKETMAKAIVSKFTKDLKTGFESAKINLGDYISYTAKDTKKGIEESIGIDSVKFLKDQQKEKERIQKEYTSWWTQELNKREAIEKSHIQALAEDASRTKRNVAEQEKYNKAVDKTTSEFEKLKTKAEGASERVSRTANKKSQSEMKALTSEVDKLQKEFQQLASTGKMTTREFDKWNNKLSETSQKIVQAERNANKGGNTFLNLGEKMKIAASSFMLWQVVTETFYRVKRSFQEGVQSVIDLDTAMVELIKVTDETQSVYENFRDTSFEVADSIASTAQEVVNASAGFARMGYNIREAAELGELALIFKNVGDEIENVDESTASLIATMKGFAMEAEDASHIVDAINEISNNFAVTSGDLADGVERVSAVMSQSNVSFEQTLGLITGATEVMQDAAKASTGLRFLTQRLRGVDEEGEKIVGFVPQLEQAFSKIGVTLQDSNGQIRNTYDILQDLANVYPTLDQNTKQYIGETCSPCVQKCA